MAAERDIARLRQKYTGEGRAVALEWYRAHGLHQGLVPDAADWVQELLEGGVLQALSRPTFDPGKEVSADTLFGVAAASPSVDALTLWLEEADVPLILARVLPSQVGLTVSGVPWLRPWLKPDEDLVLGLIGQNARITVRVKHVVGEGRTARVRAYRAGREALEQAHALIRTVGGTPLWTTPLPQPVEGSPLELLSRPFALGEATRWSRTLRRPGLFVQHRLDARSLPPSVEKLEGPSPARIAPRAVGPARTSGGSVVAVTAANGRGGSGSTTTALALAGGLARLGSRVLLLGSDDPSSAIQLFGDQQPPTFTGAGSLTTGLVPSDPEEARNMVSRSRDLQYDIVVVDAGWQHRYLVGDSDLVLAVLTDRLSGGRSLWTDTKVVDGRPEYVRMWQWLDDAYVQWRAPEPDPVTVSMSFLDRMFALYVTARAEDGNAAVYDASDLEGIEEWWSDWEQIQFNLSARTRMGSSHHDDHDEDETVGWPVGEHVPQEGGVLDAWRTDFLQFLHAEGLARHPDHWARATAGWAKRHRERLEAGLAPGEQTEDEWSAILKAFLADTETNAVKEWGLAPWEKHRSRWAIAFIHDDDLLEPFKDLIEYEETPRKGTAIAHDLASQIRELPPMPVLGVLNRAPHDVDAGQLSDTASALTAHGLTGLVVLPDLIEWQMLWHDPSTLATPPPRAATTSLALARSVTKQLPQRVKGEQA
ncbi:ParA family protein (plasmid) [Streptomyces sp. AHU1]|uniref:ParA family protein n=1 Tax=Streptomyces sp. AHU1 TaxID=3377215 RepID=UPI003877CAE7